MFLGFFFVLNAREHAHKLYVEACGSTSTGGYPTLPVARESSRVE